MEPGSYTLLVELAEPATVEFGAQGAYDLDAGWYARHWHVDYLLGHPESRVAAVYVTEHEDVECETARALNDAASPVEGLGASDCDCGTHLAYGATRETVEAVAAERHDHPL